METNEKKKEEAKEKTVTAAANDDQTQGARGKMYNLWLPARERGRKKLPRRKKAPTVK